MMHQPISDSSLAYHSMLGIINMKRAVRFMAIGLIPELSMKRKNIIFQMPFKSLNIRLSILALSVLLPASKQIF